MLWKLNQYMEDNIYVNLYIKLLDEKSPDFGSSEQKENKCDYSLIFEKFSMSWGPIFYYILYYIIC